MARQFYRKLAPAAVAFMALLPGKAAYASPSDCLSLEPNESHQFKLNDSHASGDNLIWMVDGVPGGAPEIGMITEQGLYTAPANMDKAVNVQVMAALPGRTDALKTIFVCNAIYIRPGRTFHVSTSGSNGDSGGARSPWRSIQHAVDQARPGDTILVHGGVYNETITITRSGTAEGGFITLMEAPGEEAIIDGDGLVQEPHGMRGLITLADASYVRIKDFEIRNYRSGSEFITIGILVQGSGERIEIRNNIIHRIEANNLPSRGNADALGIAVYGQHPTPLRNVIIDGNELFHLKTGTSESLTVGGNVEGWQITNNSVHDNNFIGIDATGYYVDGAEHDRARRGWIAGNTVYNLSSANNQALTFPAAAIGIYVDGGRNITVERNTVDANDGGIWLLSEHPGKHTSDVIVRNNLVRWNRDAGILVGGYDKSQSGGAERCTIANNTLFENNNRNVPGIHAGELQIGHHTAGIRVLNNILYAGPKGYAVTRFSPAVPESIDLAHNLYFASSGEENLRWFWVDQNFYNKEGAGGNFDAFRSATGEEGGLIESPAFLNPAVQDLRLRSGSPAIDSGINPGLSDIGLWDHAMNPRVSGPMIDRGALELRK